MAETNDTRASVSAKLSDSRSMGVFGTFDDDIWVIIISIKFSNKPIKQPISIAGQKKLYKVVIICQKSLEKLNDIICIKIEWT